MAFKLQKSDGNSSTWADPAMPDLTVRLKQTQTVKALAGKPVVNHLTEVIVSDSHDVVVAGDTVRDTLSVRLRVSGAQESATQLQEIVDLLSNCTSTLWTGENWIEGFTPSTVPAMPV